MPVADISALWVAVIGGCAAVLGALIGSIPLWFSTNADHRSVWSAMESLERFTGPHVGVFTYTGHLSIEDIEERWLGGGTSPVQSDHPG